MKPAIILSDENAEIGMATAKTLRDLLLAQATIGQELVDELELSGELAIESLMALESARSKVADSLTVLTKLGTDQG